MLFRHNTYEELKGDDMKKLFYSVMLVAAFSSLQGCFWHSTKEVDHDTTVPASSSTTVVTPGSTTTTTAP